MYKNQLFKFCFIVVFGIASNSFASYYFAIEGTTGAGKSTLLHLLEKELNEIQVVYEPVDPLQDVGGNGNLLELYYKDRTRWTYLFQTYACMLQDEAIKNAFEQHPASIIIGDRSTYSTFYVFGKMLSQSGVFQPMEWYVYQQWFNYTLARTNIKPQGFIYLRTTPEVCYEQIKKRNRIEEQDAPFDFYQDEFNFHERWLIDKEDIDQPWLKEVPVLVLNGDLDFLHDEDVLKDMVEQIRVFISSQLARLFCPA